MPSPIDKKIPASREEIRFLRGPKTRRFEFFRSVRILIEFIKGFRKLHFAGPCVSIFGSARFEPDHPYFSLGVAVGERIAQLGFTVLTGGGPGIMAAANKGAKQAGGRSIGCVIQLPREASVNEYCDDWVEFRYFFVRKVMLVKYSYAFVALPGGFGTMDEVFETLTLMQTGKIEDFPVVLIGTEYWSPLVEFMRSMIGQGTISDEDFEMLLITDDLDEMVRHIEDAAVRRYGLQYTPPVRRLPFFGEG